MHRPRTFPPLARATAAIMLADVTGIVVAVATDLSGARHAVVSGSQLNAPVPFMVVQAIVALAAVRWRDRIAGTAMAAVLILLCAVSVVSGFADGSFGSSALNAGDVAIQAAIAVATLIVAALAGAQVTNAIRRPAARAAC